MHRLLLLSCLATYIGVTLPVFAQGGVTEYNHGAPQKKSSSSSTASDLAPYLSSVERKIGERGPKKFIGQVTLSFVLDKTGAVSNVKLSKSSGMPQIDTQATDAVKSAAPFEALPPGAGKSIIVQVSFEGTSQNSSCHAIRVR